MMRCKRHYLIVGETLVVTVSNSTPNGILTMESVKNSLLNEEARRKEKD